MLIEHQAACERRGSFTQGDKDIDDRTLLLSSEALVKSLLRRGSFLGSVKATLLQFLCLHQERDTHIPQEGCQQGPHGRGEERTDDWTENRLQ